MLYLQNQGRAGKARVASPFTESWPKSHSKFSVIAMKSLKQFEFTIQNCSEYESVINK